MKKGIVIIVLLLNCFWVFGQKKLLDSKKDYIRVPNSGMWTEKTEFSHYLRFDGFNVVDIRKATSLQKQRIQARERIIRLQNDRFWGLTILSDRYPFPRQSLGLRFEQNTGAKVYEGIKWKWGTLYRNTILIAGRSDVEVVDGLITPGNAKDYRYRIIRNDNLELVGWSTPSVFKKTVDDSATYCFLVSKESIYHG